MIRHRTCLLRVLRVLLALLSPLPARADNYFDDSSELVLSSYRVVAERPAGEGLSEVDVAADLTNVGTGTWLNAGATITSAPPEMQVLQLVLRFDTVPATGSVASSNSWTLSVPTEKVAGLLQDFEEGTIEINVLGLEVPVYAGPTFFLDEPTDAVYSGWQKVGVNDMLVFTAVTPLLEAISVGDVLLEEPLPGGYKSHNGLTSLLPRKVVSKTVNDNDVVQLEGAILLGGDILSGTYSTDIGYSVQTGETIDITSFQIGVKNCEDESHLPQDGTPRRECTFRGLPFRFNDLEITAGVKASGEIRLSAGISSLEVRFRGLLPSRVVADLQLEYTASLELKAEAGTEFAKIEKILWTVPLPIFTVFIGGVPVALSLSVDFLVGAECDLRAEGITSISQNVKTGMLVGISDGEVVFEPYFESVPFKFTPPQVRDSSGFHLKGWAGLDATLIVDEIEGPFVKTTGYGLVKVEPLNDPWWTIEAGVDVTAGVRAGFHIPLLGDKDLFKEPVSKDWNFPLATFPTESSGSGGGQGGDDDGGEGRGGGGAGAEPRLAGENVRWATTLHAKSGVYGDTLVHSLANGDSLLISHGGVGVLARIDSRGDVVWQESLGLSFLLDAMETDSSTIIVAGGFIKDVYLAELDANGVILWQRTYLLDSESQATSFTTSTDEAGKLSIYIVGFSSHGSIFERDPCIYRFDEAGRLIWAKSYVSPGADTVSAVHGAPDGGIVLAGATDANVGEDLGMNGLIFRINKDGDLIWGTALANFRGGNFESVSVSPEGMVWASGNASRTLRENYPSIWVARLDLEDGTGANTLISQDMDWEQYLDMNASPDLPPTEKTAGGHTPYDTGFAIEPFESGAIIAGSSGLGANKTAIACRLDQSLGVQWMTLFDGPLEDLFSGAAIAEDGIVLAGSSFSFTPANVGGNRAALIQKLPFEGLLDYAPSAGIVTRYAQPQMREAAGLSAFAPGGISRGDVTYDVETLPLVPKATRYNAVATRLEATRFGAAFESGSPPAGGIRFARGDCNADGSVQGITDAYALLSYAFLGGLEPPCLVACDATGDGSIAGVADAIYLLSYFFLGGPAPQSPFPECGVGSLATDEMVGCLEEPVSCKE